MIRRAYGSSPGPSVEPEGAPGRSRGERRPHTRRGEGSVRPAVPRDRHSAGSGREQRPFRRCRGSALEPPPLGAPPAGLAPPVPPPPRGTAARRQRPLRGGATIHRAGRAPREFRGGSWEWSWGTGGRPVPHSPPRGRRGPLSPRSSQCRGRLRPPGKHEPREAKGEEAAKSVPPPSAGPAKKTPPGGKKTKNQNQTFLAAVSPSPEEHEPKHTRTRPHTALRVAHWIVPRRPSR